LNTPEIKTAKCVYRSLKPFKEVYMNRRLSIIGYVDKGYNGHSTTVECSIRSGFPGFDITGLPGASVREARERVRCALRSSGFKFPQNRVLVNLSPASQPKDSTLLDLPLACAILTSMQGNRKETEPNPVKVMIAGELTLSGEVLPAAQSEGALDAARRSGCSFCIIPAKHLAVEDITDMTVIKTNSLNHAFSICCDIMMGNLESQAVSDIKTKKQIIFEDVIGMEHEKETLAMASSGFHSILLFGPPGVGKTMLSLKLHLLLPDLSDEGRSEIARILGCTDMESDLESADPTEGYGRFRMLGHDCTQIQFLSGAGAKSPGEGALAHLGTLVLDEINKYPPKLLETVKDSYDKGFTQSSRSGELISYPSRFLMVGNMNACACGGLGDEDSICSCTAQKLANHWGHVGRQLIERFDIRLPVSTPKAILTRMGNPIQADAFFTEKVSLSAERQKHRYKEIENVDFNGQIHYSTTALSRLTAEIDLFCKMGLGSNLNSRSQISLIALARTIADYDDRPDVSEEDFSNAQELRRYALGDYYWRSLR
jgi:magnesium chelatase family protein